MENNIPEVGKIYNCFDDGKVRESRKYKVLITRVIPYKEAIKELYINNLCSSRIPKIHEKGEYQLFAIKDEQDFVIEGISYEDRRPHVCYFAKTNGGGWFGLGTIEYDYENEDYYNNDWWCSGRLDVDGSLWNGYLRAMKEWENKNK